LRNSRFVFFDHKPADEAINDLFETSGAFKTAAINKLPKYLMVDGAFNVNSTSANAWAAFLGSVSQQEVLTSGGNPQQFDNPLGTLGYAVNSALSGVDGDWRGLRNLSTAQITALASAIVTEVRDRGPFLSVADFVNRRPNSSNAEHAAVGALQAAINKSGLNDRYTGGNRGVDSSNFGSLPGASVVGGEPKSSRTAGAAGYLSQAMLLTPMGSQITVRGDTFTIRAYGEARSAANVLLAKAWCEAVIQRTPEYLDSVDEPEAQDRWPTPSDRLSTANSLFGRRMEIKSFRWLNESEI
jgi:hypothetical protein